MPPPPETFQEGQLVYLLAPSAATLRTKTRKCRADFVGPLIVNKILDQTHYILDDLQGRVLIGVFHINRLKKATVRTPSGTVSTYQQLHDSFTHITEQEANEATPVPDIIPAAAPFTPCPTDIILDVDSLIHPVNAYWIQFPSIRKEG